MFSNTSESHLLERTFFIEARTLHYDYFIARF